MRATVIMINPNTVLVHVQGTFTFRNYIYNPQLLIYDNKTSIYQYISNLMHEVLPFPVGQWDLISQKSDLMFVKFKHKSRRSACR